MECENILRAYQKEVRETITFPSGEWRSNKWLETRKVSDYTTTFDSQARPTSLQTIVLRKGLDIYNKISLLSVVNQTSDEDSLFDGKLVK